MRVMAGSAIADNTLSRPIGDPFSMGPTQPVTFLSEMALPAEQITMIEIDLLSFLILQEVLIVPMVAVDAGEAASFLAMIDRDRPMGQGLPVSGKDLCRVMAAAAAIPFNEFLAGQNLESPALIPFFGDNGFLGDRLDRFDGGSIGNRRLADPVKD